MACCRFLNILPELKRHHSYHLFASRPAAGIKILFFIALSIVLMTLDHRYHNLEIMRGALATLTYPIRLAAALPNRIGGELSEDFSRRRALLARNEALQHQALKLQARLLRMKTLERENTRLRALMDAAGKTRGKVRVGEIMSVDLDPFRQQVAINKGGMDGVYVGQPLLGARGVMGQITHVDPFSSIAILITDPNTAVPVEISRNGLRTIAVGTGDSAQLDLPFLTNNADIKTGDVLVTSGLGERFPRGYPVAVVTEVTRKPGAPFADVSARPTAELSRSHELLLLWPPGNKHSPPPEKTAAAQQRGKAKP